MKKKEKQSLWQKETGEIGKLIAQKREELLKVKVNMAETKNKNLPKKLKREIAVMLSILEEKKFKESLKG